MKSAKTKAFERWWRKDSVYWLRQTDNEKDPAEIAKQSWIAGWSAAMRSKRKGQR